MSMIGDERPCETTGLGLGDNVTKPFKESSMKMKVFQPLKGCIAHLATCPETLNEHNFCKKEMLNWFSSTHIRSMVGHNLVNDTLL